MYAFVTGPLAWVAFLVFFVRFFRMACIEHGLTEGHYRWPVTRVQLLRAELDRLTWIFLPAAMVVAVTFLLDPLNAGWAIGRIAFLILAVSLSFACQPVANASSADSYRSAKKWAMPS